MSYVAPNYNVLQSMKLMRYATCDLSLQILHDKVLSIACVIIMHIIPIML